MPVALVPTPIFRFVFPMSILRHCLVLLSLASAARLRAELIRMRERENVLKKSLGILSETLESGMPRFKR